MKTNYLLKKTKVILSVILINGFIFSSYAQENKDSEYKPSGNLWGQIFGDYAFKVHNDTLQRGGGNVQYKGTNSINSGNTTANTGVPANVQSNGFQLRRVYLGYDYQFTKNFSTTLVLANEQNYDASGKNTVYVKYANLKWSNIFKNTDLVIGQFQTVSYQSSYNKDALWGYRSVERTLIDMHNIDGSTDLGFSLQGKIWTGKNSSDTLKPAIIGYALQVGNGNGAVPETDVFKKIRGNLYSLLLGQRLTIGLYGDYVVTQLTPYHTSNTTLKAYAGFKTDWFTIGAEVFQQTNQNSDVYKVAKINNGIASITGVLADTASGVQFGWSVFATGKIIKNKLNAFVRFDIYNPDTKWNANNVYSKAATAIQGSDLTASTFYKQTFILAGLDWTPNSRLQIIPNVWYNGYTTFAASAGAGGTGPSFSSRVKNDYDLVYRLTFNFIFGAK